ncbi:hypothetical protein R1T16_10860 [Flavobacterium sp. DG1-102-2]|uniref:hypothetical protein n=1 Tax=Flavobacterium sp. DG1-102-2 TaxID=3081663 RepID=UPI002949D223|nr:hypothetical protein [Flavobacterium sp. DG1-102-2]MDV6168928.1 hypothetical protein [Flavobacterium sp. DG1-102-2]
MKRYLATVLLTTLIFISCKKEEKQIDEPVTTESQTIATVDTVTDAAKPKIERPEKPVIKTALNTELLFNTCVSDPSGPHADFVLSKKSFYVVDYDGNGDMPYVINGDSLTVYYETETREAKIISLTENNLILQWSGVEESTNYVIWKV